MTNHWADIGNSTCVIVWGANPAENHPACIAHINRARFPKQFFPDGSRNSKTAARMIVVDPRKTRTASMINEANGDRYIRIRPGTDIALENAIISYWMTKMESAPGSFYSDGVTVIPETIKQAYFAFLNQSAATGGTFYRDGYGGASGGTPAAAVYPNYSKYTDAKAVVNSLGNDYERTTVAAATADQTSNVLVRASDCRAANNGGNVNTVYERLRAHVAPYTLARAAAICDCSEADITYIADEMLKNSRFAASSDGTLATIENRPAQAAFRATTILYAMGLTQHTCGSQNIKGFANMQILMGNMGRCGGGINALRGIHNVQGSTDMGLLYGNIPAYSANPTIQTDVDPNGFGKYVDALWGYPLWGSGNRAAMDASYNDAYVLRASATLTTNPGWWQQNSFHAMTKRWFGPIANVNPYSATYRADLDKLYRLWPKGQGDNHITMFRNMGRADGDAKRIKGAVIWGQNPAVTEPNQGAIRTGLKQLDTLVLADMFETETVAAERRADGVTFLFPAAAHVEKAGSATNSGRTLQWRYQATAPAGNSRDDNELLLRFAKALDDAGAFSHIYAAWSALSGTPLPTTAGSVYTTLYGTPYGGFDGVSSSGATGFTGVTGTGEMANLRKNITDTVSYVNQIGTLTPVTNNLVGSEWIAEATFREMCVDADGAATDNTGGLAEGTFGTIWIYNLAYATKNLRTHTGQAAWAVKNRAKSRDRQDPNGTLAYPGWGYSWLVNRRVLYNNNAANPGAATNEVPGDIQDFFMGPDSCARLFVSDRSTAINYSRWYRTIHRLSDKPGPVIAKNYSSFHYVDDPNGLPGTKISYAGRFPGHVEPYESPKATYSALDAWGANTKGTAVGDLLPAGTKTAADFPAGQFPLTLTTIRCVEHFQGGPITRNNWWNVSLEPEPWIEISSYDARLNNIVDGDYVKVVTARTEDLVNNEMPLYGSGFRARVGVGLPSNQRVAPGVVAIPWHWGDQGLSTGSRANDLTIDASDANTAIPEYKACLCRIEKIVL